MPLRLERPLVSFDLETTGLDVKIDRIVELSCVKIFPDGKRKMLTMRINPRHPISEEASNVHGIWLADIENEPAFPQIGDELFAFLDQCDLTGFNVEKFDLPMLSNEFQRIGRKFPSGPIHVIDTYRLYIKKEPRDLASAYRYYCDSDLANAHSAEADAVAAADILLKQVEYYSDVPRSLGDLYDFIHPIEPGWLDPDGKLTWKGDDIILHFGKYRDQPLKAIVQRDPRYLKWVTGADFSDEVVGIILDALDNKWPAPPKEGT